MYNFFVDSTKIEKDVCYIDGADFNHVKNVLRLKKGDTLLISTNGCSHLCELTGFTEAAAACRILQENYMDTSLPVSVTLFQGLPKADKMELIIQKAVELGASAIVPVQTARSVVKLDGNKKDSKRERWQAIAESAAKQSKRSSVPEVFGALSYKEMLEAVSKLDLLLVPYENELGMSATLESLKQIKRGMKIGVLIGPEGGFDDKEIELIKAADGKVISLGKRILRTETAAITALSMIMLYAECTL